MAVLAPALTGAILAAGTAFSGSQLLPKIALAVGQSVSAWLPSPTNVLVNGVTTGVLGAGTITGKLQVVGSGTLVSAALAAAGLVGTTSIPLGSLVEAGCLSALNAGLQYTGVSAGVGVGTDVSKVVLANSATLIPILLGNLSGAGVSGQLAPQLATGLANGIASLVLTGTGFGAVTGGGGPLPGAGTSISTVF